MFHGFEGHVNGYSPQAKLDENVSIVQVTTQEELANVCLYSRIFWEKKIISDDHRLRQHDRRIWTAGISREIRARQKQCDMLCGRR